MILKFRLVENVKFILITYFSFYIGRLIFSSENITKNIQPFLAEKDTRFKDYLGQIQDNAYDMTFYLQFLYIVSIIAMCLNMKKLNKYQKSLTFAIMLGIMLHPYLWADSVRLMMYLTIYWIILIPVLLSKIQNSDLRKLFVFLWILYSVNNLFKSIGAVGNHKWLDSFQLIFQAPNWL